MRFDPDRFYRPSELGGIAPEWKLCQWRFHGKGPAYHKFGQQVSYDGADLNTWLDERRVVPTETTKENRE